MIVCNASGSVAMATRNKSTNGAYTRNGHIKIAREIGVRTRHRLISVCHRYISSIECGSVLGIANCVFSDCNSCIMTWRERHLFRSTIILKLGVLLQFERYADGYIFWPAFSALLLYSIGRWYEMVLCSTCNVCHMRQFCRFFYCLAWFDNVAFNRLPCPNDKKYDDVVFVDRFRYQLTMFGIRVSIWFSRLLRAHIMKWIPPNS